MTRSGQWVEPVERPFYAVGKAESALALSEDTLRRARRVLAGGCDPAGRR